MGEIRILDKYLGFATLVIKLKPRVSTKRETKFRFEPKQTEKRSVSVVFRFVS
jgi:hypothetical protein